LEKYIGIDVGGTNVKIGVVSKKGELLEKIKYPTAELTEGKGFIVNFCKAIQNTLDLYPGINKVGLGVPGLISKDRRTLIKLTNIPSLDGVCLVGELEKAFPKLQIKLENDAKVACLGEFYFSEHTLPDSFLMITLGTGIGGAAMIDGELFVGGSGNGVEIGHMLGSKDKVYEDFISKRATVAYVLKELEKSSNKKSSLNDIPKDELDSKMIEAALREGDAVAEKAYKNFGKWLGRNIVSSLRVLDVRTVLLGGGVSKTFKYMKDPMYKVINQHLGNYYTEDLEIKKASLGNDAGIIGAAALNF
jgi:glucokinase